MPSLLIAACAAFALAGCARHHEAQRLPAPGGGIEAVLVAAELGRDLDYDVRIVPAGAAAGAGALALHLGGVTHEGTAPGVRLQWLEPGLLLVRFADARTREQPAPKVEVAGRVVRIELQQGPLD